MSRHLAKPDKYSLKDRVTTMDVDNDEIEFFNFSKFKLKCSYDLNQITNENTSVFMIKENKSFPSEFACVKSDNTINYFKISENDVFLLNCYKEHTAKINDICFFDQTQNPFDKSFLTASSDSTIKIWDIRCKTSVTTLKTKSGMKFNSIDTLNNIFVSGCGEEIHVRDLSKLDKVKLKKDAHTSDVMSTRLKIDKTNSNNLLLLSGSKDKYLNLFNLNDDFINNSPIKRIYSGDSIMQASLFGKQEYYFDVVTFDHSYQIFNNISLSPIVNFRGKNDIFKSDYIVKSDYIERDNSIELYCGNYNGDIILISIMLSNLNPVVSFDSIFPTNYNQIISSMVNINDNHLLVTSDQGRLYVIEKGDKYFENLDRVEDEEIISFKQQMNINKNIRSKKFAPY